MPSVYLSDTDQSIDHGPGPTSGTIVCRRVSELTSISAGRYLEKILQILIGELP